MFGYIDQNGILRPLPPEEISLQWMVHQSQNVEATRPVKKDGEKEGEGGGNPARKKLRSYREQDAHLRKEIRYAHQIMSAPVHTLAPSNTVGEALSFFGKHAFDWCPIVEGEKLVGLLSETGLLRYLVQRHNEGTFTPDDKLEQVYDKEVVTGSLQEEMRNIAKLFLNRRVEVLLVTHDNVREKGHDNVRVAGIITQGDLLKHYMESLSLDLLG